MEKYCHECGQLMKGRADKRFCSDLCRTTANNRKNLDNAKYMQSINWILRKNRRILKEIIGTENNKANVHKEKLQKQGFSFKHLTHIHKTKKGDTFFFCYEFGYLPLEKDFFFLVKWDNDK